MKSENNKGISIIICCYNSVKRLSETIKRIALQKNTDEIPCEIIIVNNNSKDNTTEIAGQEIKKYSNLSKRFSIINETTPGLAYARKKGCETAKYEYILFCDDDNWLDESYIATLYSLFNQHPNLGIIGAGRAYGEYETSPPKWFLQYKNFCAIFETRQVDEIGYTINDDIIACGAGMGIRKYLANEYFDEIKNIEITDRTENLLLSGGDSDMNYFVLKKGLGVGKFVGLHFKHFMPKERISKSYLKKLAYGLSYSNVLLAKKNNLPINKWSFKGYYFTFLKTLFFKGLFQSQILKNQYLGQKHALNKL